MSSMTLRATHRVITAPGLAHLMVVNVGWSSTHLAIRVALREGAGFPLHETIGLETIVGAALVLLGVVGVFRDRQARGDA